MHNGIAYTKTVFLLCISLSFTSFLYSQQQVTEREPYLLMKTLNDDNGLPQNSVITQYIDTASGMMWLATYSGLVRFNGINARDYHPGNTKKLETHKMVCLFKTRDGKVFGMNANSQLAAINGQVFTINNDYAYFYKKHNLFIWFRGILDSLNDIKKLAMLEVSGQEYYEMQSAWVKNNSNANVTAMPGGQIAVVSRQNELLIYKDKRIALRKANIESKLSQVVYRNGYLYALDPKLLGACAVVDANGAAPFTLSLSKELETLRRGQYTETKLLYNELNDQLFWLTDNTVYLLRLEKGEVSVERSFALSLLPGTATSLSYYNRHHLLFIGTSTEGLQVFRKNHFVQLHTTQTGADINSNYAQQLLPGNQLRTNRGVVYDLVTCKPVQHLKKDNHVWTTFSMDSNGTLYQHNDDTVFALARGAQQYRVLYVNQRLPGMHQNIIKFAIYDTIRNRLWIMETRRWGYLQKGRYHAAVPYQKQDIPMPTSFTSQGNTIVLGTDKGVVVLDATSYKWDTIQGTGNMEVRFVRFDTNPRYCWVGTYAHGYGLLDLQQKKIHFFPKDPRNFLLNVHALIEDSTGQIWATTNKGLFRFSKKEMLQNATGKTHQLYYDYFNRQDGLATNEFNGGCQPVYNWWRGQLLASNINGITLFDPSAVAPYHLDEPLYIDHAQTSARPVIESNGDNPWQFRKTERNIKWIINKPCWDNEYSLHIEYKLDNEEQWHAVHTLPAAIELESLTSGYHSLQIRNYAALGSGRFITRNIEFFVAQQWYEQLWAQLFGGILVAILLFLTMRWNTVRLSQRNKELEKKVNDRTGSLQKAIDNLDSTNKVLEKSNTFKTKLISILMHDIATPSAGIQNVSELLYENGDKIEVAVRLQTLKEINNTAGKLTKLSKQLVLWTRIQKNISNLGKIPLNLHAVIEDLDNSMEEELTIKDNVVRNNVPFDLTVVTDPDILKLLLQNLLTNSNKFTEKGIIEAGASRDAQSVTFFIKDNGIGMPEDVRKELEKEQPVPSRPDTRNEKSWGWGLGYQVIFDLLLLIHGKIHIESVEGNGTTVIITIPQEKSLQSKTLRVVK